MSQIIPPQRVVENQPVVSHPQPGIEFFERVVSGTMTAAGQACACTAYEKGDETGLAVLYADAKTGQAARLNIPTAGPAAGQPAIAASGDELALVWLEYGRDQNWRLMHTTLRDQQAGTRRCLWISDALLMYPTLCRHSRRWHVAFTALSPADNCLTIQYAVIPEGDGPIEPLKLPGSGEDANRVAMASNGQQLMLAWDSMSDAVGCIDYSVIDEAGVPGPVQTIGRPNERWLSPFLASDSKAFYLSWVISADVQDAGRGIVDHKTSAGCARISQETCTYLPASPEDDAVVAADLRPGLLGHRQYRGYYGLRRRPRPVVCADGQVYLVWEAMLEKAVLQGAQPAQSTPSCGQLVACKLTGDTWGQPLMVHQGGTNYALPASSPASGITIVYFDLLNGENGPLFCATDISLGQGEPLSLVPDAWAGWQPYLAKSQSSGRYIAQDGQDRYQLFWADTHTHSVFSPDAEGEPDEMVRFGHDVSGLDAMAMVDNDFYPYFGLTRLKWQIHLALADHFTQTGRFALFPGYEYTYHDASLKPNFNHRYVLYPRGRGGLFRRTDRVSNHMQGLMQALEGSEALPVTHHTTWQLSASEKDRHVEVCSSWRVCKEESDFIDKRLLAGDRFSFIGSSDTHRFVPGLGGALTGIYARDLTPEAIFEAYRAHRVIATQGNRTVIDLRVAGLFIGQLGSAEGDVPVALTVQAEQPIESVTLLRDGQAVRTFEPGDKNLSTRFIDPCPPAGKHVYYVRVKLAGDPSFNAPDGVQDNERVFFAVDQSRYPHNFARAEGPFAWCTPIWVETKG